MKILKFQYNLNKNNRIKYNFNKNQHGFKIQILKKEVQILEMLRCMLRNSSSQTNPSFPSIPSTKKSPGVSPRACGSIRPDDFRSSVRRSSHPAENPPNLCYSFAVGTMRTPPREGTLSNILALKIRSKIYHDFL